MNQYLCKYFVNYNAVYNKVIICIPESLEKEFFGLQDIPPSQFSFWDNPETIFLLVIAPKSMHLWPRPIYFQYSRSIDLLITGHLSLDTTEAPQPQQVKNGAHCSPCECFSCSLYWLRASPRIQPPEVKSQHHPWHLFLPHHLYPKALSLEFRSIHISVSLLP